LISKEVLEQALREALQGGGDFAEIYLEDRESTSILSEDDQIERVISGREAGCGIRVLVGDKTSYAHTNDFSPQGLIELAATVAKAAGDRGRLSPPVNLPQEPQRGRLTVQRRPDQVPVAEKAGVVEQANQAARQVSQAIEQVTVGYADTVKRVTTANSDGVWVEQEVIRTRLMVNVVVRKGEEIQTGYDAVGGTVGFELFRDHDPARVGAQAAERAVALLKAPRAPAGKMAVVLSGEAGGTMVHEACGHGLEADLVQKELSVYAGKLGQQVASPLVTVIDDATLPGKYGSAEFDDEGTPGQRTVLIENGVLKSYLYDLLTARKEQRRSTGNGRRESYRYQPIPRMTNTFIAPGADDPEQIIADTPQGLLVKKMGGGQVNTTNGDFVFEVAEGYLIKNGKAGDLVRGATLTGNGPQVLAAIDRVGRDQGFAIGTCGKDGQGVPVSDAQPTIRIPELIVGGQVE